MVSGVRGGDKNATAVIRRVCEIDLRVGGAYRYVWRGPDGPDMGMIGQGVWGSGCHSAAARLKTSA